MNCIMPDDQLHIINTGIRMHEYSIMALVLNCLFYEDFVIIALYTQLKKIPQL